MPEAQETRLREYVLGLLPVEGREAVEQQMFESTELLEQLELMEEEVIRDFVAGALSTEETAAFRMKRRQNPAIQDRVDAEMLLRNALMPAPPVLAEESMWDRIANWFRMPILQFATTAAAVTAIGVAIWQASENRELRGQLTAAAAEQSALRGEMAVLSAKATPTPVGFLLDTRLDRSGAQPRFVLPPANTPVELRLGVGGPPAASYRIRLETVEGLEVASGQSPNPVLLIPGGVLKPRQEYVVRAEAIAPDGRATPLRSFPFATAATLP